eukprot:284818806_4
MTAMLDSKGAILARILGGSVSGVHWRRVSRDNSFSGPGFDAGPSPTTRKIAWPLGLGFICSPPLNPVKPLPLLSISISSRPPSGPMLRFGPKSPYLPLNTITLSALLHAMAVLTHAPSAMGNAEDVRVEAVAGCTGMLAGKAAPASKGSTNGRTLGDNDDGAHWRTVFVHLSSVAPGSISRMMACPSASIFTCRLSLKPVYPPVLALTLRMSLTATGGNTGSQKSISAFQLPLNRASVSLLHANFDSIQTPSVMGNFEGFRAGTTSSAAAVDPVNISSTIVRALRGSDAGAHCRTVSRAPSLGVESSEVGKVSINACPFGRLLIWRPCSYSMNPPALLVSFSMTFIRPSNGLGSLSCTRPSLLPLKTIAVALPQDFVTSTQAPSASGSFEGAAGAAKTVKHAAKV